MPPNKEDLHELLSYQDNHAPWFMLPEHQPDVLKRNLRFLRKLNSASTLSLEELERLSEQSIKDALLAYVSHKSQNPPTPILPTTPAQFFHSRMNQSPYFFDIISYSDTHSKAQSSDATLSTSTQTSRTVTEQVHGFSLNKGEAFSSTRYYSEDKKSYAQIVAKNGTFTAKSEHLTEAQNRDLALEMSYQFLLNMPPDKKEIHINGSREDVHRLYAALLYLKKEAAPRLDEIKFHVPKGLSITPDDGYITRHLGTFSEPPRQIVQWQEFLKMELNTPSHDADTQPKPSSKRTPLIDMERVFNSDDLSQHDKSQLNEYQRYLQDVWVDGVKELKERASNTDYLIATHEEFMQRTESALRILKKNPTLKQEFDAVTFLYTGEMESQYETLNKLYQNDLNYETQVKEVMSQLQKADKEAMAECIHLIGQHLESAKTLTIGISNFQQNTLIQHQKKMDEIDSLMNSLDVLSDEMCRSFGSQILRALNDLESMKDYSSSPIFQQMKEFSLNQSERESRIVNTDSARLFHASNQVKQRLNQFKSELQTPAESEVPLSTELKEQLSALKKKIERFANGLEADDARTVLEELHNQLENISTKISSSPIKWDVLKQKLEDALPYIESNCSLTKACTDLKKQISIPSEQMILSKETHEPPSLNR